VLIIFSSPQTKEELFNLRHTQLRNVIERIFGVMKHRFRVLRAAPEIGYRQQALMVNAAGTLQNFLRVHAGINELEGDEEYDVEENPFFAGNNDNAPPPPAPALGNEERTRADARRDRIAQAMWDKYILDHPDLQ
jgi:hypothetical protein